MNDLKKGMVFDRMLPIIYGSSKQPCVIVQSIKYNSESQTVIVCPIIPATSIDSSSVSVAFSHGDSEYAIVVSNPITVQVSQLSNPLYCLDNSVVNELNKSLRLVFGIPPVQVVKADNILQELQSMKQEIMDAIVSALSCSSPVVASSSAVVGVPFHQSESDSPSFPLDSHQSRVNTKSISKLDEELVNLAKYLVGEISEEEMENLPKKQKKSISSGIRIRWTDSKVDQFLADCDSMPTHAVADKWGISTAYVATTKSRFKKDRAKRKDK